LGISGFERMSGTKEIKTGNLGNWNYYMEWKSGGLKIRRGWGKLRDHFLLRLLLLLRGSVLS
jgi:hypothetical protein